MAAPFLRHHFLDHARRRLFCHGERKPVGWADWTVHMEFNADGCRRAIVAGQSGQQLWLVGIGRRVNQRDRETVRHSGERQPARAYDRIHAGPESYADTAASSHSAASAGVVAEGASKRWIGFSRRRCQFDCRRRKYEAAKPRSTYQRVEDNAFHPCSIAVTSQRSSGIPFPGSSWPACWKCFSASSVIPRSWSRRPSIQW